MFNEMIERLEFGNIHVKKVYSIAAVSLAQSVSNTRLIQTERMNMQNSQFLSDNWQNKSNPELREKVLEHFHKKCLFWEWNQGKSIKDGFVLPVVHGTDRVTAWNIAKTGFANLATLDDGFFGSGIYFSTSAMYTVPYFANKKHPAILICLSVPGNPFPVIESPNEKAISLKGCKITTGYSAHYCSTGLGGFPYSETDKEAGKPVFDELVVGQENQAVPLFLLEIDISKSDLSLYSKKNNPTKHVISDRKFVFEYSASLIT